jgi:hypothetical protein
VVNQKKMASEQAIREMNHLHSRGRAEMVLYRPTNGRPRVIIGLIDREGPQDVLTTLTPQIVVTVLNDERYGIPSKLLDTGTDRLDVAERIGHPSEPRAIQSVRSHDADWVSVVVK